MIGGPKPRLAINTAVAVFPKNSSPGPSAQQPAVIHSQKVSIPVGDACREDGTFKDANEMVWLHSPSDENSQLEPNEKWGQSPGLEFPDSPSEPASERSLSKRMHHTSGSEDDRPHKAKVSE